MFPADASQVGAARAFLSALLAGCPAADEAVLCLSELATNAIMHSRSRDPGGSFTVRAHLDGQRLRVEVGDQGGPWQSPGRISADEQNGRGLLIVGQPEARWGCEGHSRCGWTVWYEIEIDPHPARRGSPDNRRTGDEPPMTGSPSPTRPPQRWFTVLDGARLRQLRRQRGLSAAELAGQAGVGRSTVIRLERHPQRSCRTRTLARLAAALGQAPAALTATHHPGSAADSSQIGHRSGHPG